MKFEFGSDEATAQQARHKLEVWKQAFRLDKKLQYKLDRGEEPEIEGAAAHDAEPEVPPAKAKVGEKAHAKAKPGEKGKHKTSKAEKHETETAENGGNVTLLVRLYFSTHEKLSEQRWFDRIPSEEPFKSASPKVIREGDAEFEESAKLFSDLG